ncbi:MAG: ester cyclase [Candidatus Aminicenantes bacterium]|nr:MAG: ester cyclase [Candidatus Aminicenantes bacterium]
MKKHLFILPLVLVVCFMVGCQDKEAMAELEEFKAQAALEEENKALVMRFFDVWESGDFEDIKEILSPDYVWHTTTGQDLSLEVTIETLKQQIAMISDRAFSIEDIIPKGDKVLARYAFSGTHTGDAEGFPATGKEFVIKGIEIVRIENGKIVEAWEEVNFLNFYQQIGYELKPKEEK